MNLVELLVLEFANGELAEHNPLDWPEDVVARHSYNEIVFDGWEYFYEPREHCQGKGWMTSVGFEPDGQLKHQEEYEDAEEVTRDEYFAFVEANPNFVKDLEAKRKTNIGRIAELNKIAYNAVDEAIKLSHEAGLPYTCTMPSSVADLDENSDWDSSSC